MEQEKHPFPFNKQESQIRHVKVCHWLTGENLHRNEITKLTECWDTAWSPDGSLFAWSCGQRIVRILKTSDMTTSIQAAYDSAVTIDCRQVVTSLAFVDCSGYKGDANTQSNCYRMFHWENHSLILAVGLRNGRIRIFDICTGRILLELLDHNDCVSKISFSPDNNLLLASSSYDGTIKFWELADDGNMALTFKVGDYTMAKGVRHKVRSFCWSPDGKRVAAVGTFKAVVMFDMVSRKYTHRLSGHLNHVTDCSFSSDGVLLITSSTDTLSIIWNSYTGEVLYKLGHQFPAPSLWFPKEGDTQVLSCRFTRDSLGAITTADDGYVRFWDLSHPECPTALCKVDNALCSSMTESGDVLSVGTISGDVAVIGIPRRTSSLRHLCRLASNSSLGHDIDNLQLPRDLKIYLKYGYMDI